MKDQLYTTIKGVFSLYPHVDPLSKDKFELWYEFLKEYQIQEINRAFSHFVKESEFPPTPAAIIKILRGGSVKTRALDAWDEVLRCIRLIGPYRSVRFSSPSISAAIELLGGWSNLCSQNEEDLKFLKKDFLSIYSDRESSVESNSLISIGLADQTRINFNMRPEDPISLKSIPGISESGFERLPKPQILGK